MEQTEQGVASDMPDLRDKIDSAVGLLTVAGAEIRAGGGDNHAQAGAIERAMLLLAGLQEVVAWEPGDYRFTPRGAAEQLRAMAAIGPRPPAVVKLLNEAASHLQAAEKAREVAAGKPEGELGLLMLTAERDAYDLGEQALSLGRRLAQLQARAAQS